MAGQSAGGMWETASFSGQKPFVIMNNSNQPEIYLTRLWYSKH